MKALRNTQHFQSGNHIRHGVSIVALAVFWSAPAFAQGETAAEVVADQPASGAVDNQPPASGEAAPESAQTGDRVVVTARRVEEDVQDVPIPVAVLSEEFLADTGAFNAGKIGSLVPSVQFYSTNPRNSAINIRGIGSPFGLTNDGIEQGVGLYVDGVYYARPAAAVMDFMDVERVEVLRGPQGTLYGKNTTAGAINVTTRKPDFVASTDVELIYGSLGYLQAKGTTTGPISDTLAYRLSFSGTQRDGVIYNTATEDDLNDLNNIGARLQLLWEPAPDLSFRLTADNTVQRPEGYASVFAGVVPTQRAPNRQYAAQAAFFNYAPPSTNAFDRVTDLDSPHRSYSDFGGIALSADWDIGPGTLTSISAWRYWLWDPSNDRDFLGLPITTISANPSKQYQWQQEFRYAGEINDHLSFVAGAFWFNQVTKTFGQQEQGSAAWRFLLNPNAAAATPGLLDGYGQKTSILSDHTSAALFGQLEWDVTDQLRIIPGLRFNYDEKSGFYNAVVYGGLDTSGTDPTSVALRALQRSVLAPQSYESEGEEDNVSWNLTAAWDVAENINAYATYSSTFKTFGLNNNGVPDPALATVRPEDVRHIEVGLKTNPWADVTANITAYQTTIEDFQANVVDGRPGLLRGYLSNAEEVVVQGVEFDGAAQIGDNFSLYGNIAWTDGRYETFTTAPPPLEQAGGAIVQVDASGTRLPGLSEWAASIGGEYTQPGAFGGREGEYFAAADVSYRSEFSSSPTESDFLNIEGYSLLNLRAGFRGDNGWDLFAWGRNVLDEEYFEILSQGGSSSGYYAGLPGDPRTYGVTLRGSF